MYAIRSYYGGFDDFVAVFVGTSLKTHILAAEPSEPAVGIGDNCRVRMSQMRLRVNIINRCRDIGGHNLNFV